MHKCILIFLFDIERFMSLVLKHHLQSKKCMRSPITFL